MKQVLKKHETKLRFAIVGGTNTLLDFGLLFVFAQLLLIPAAGANILSTSIAFIFSFFANKKFTFKSKGGRKLMTEMALFTVVTLFGLWVIQGVIIYLLTPAIVQLGFSEAIALLVSKLVATVVTLVWNYLLYSRVVFKSSSEK